MVKTIQNRIVYELTDLKGISDKKAQKLRDVGIFNTDDLTKQSNLQQRKLKKKFTGGLLDRLISINNRGNLRDRDVTKAAIEERKKIRERKQAEIESGESPTEIGFASATRSREEFEQAFDAFKSEFDSRSVPVAEMGRAIDTEGTAQPLINAATSRVTFASASQPADFERELEDQTEKIERKDRREPATPGEQRDSFISFVEQEIGLGGGMMNIGGFEVEEDEYEKAQERNAERSPRARDVDKQKRAPVTTNYEKWESNPRFFDFPGIDTPTDDPQKKDSDLPFR